MPTDPDPLNLGDRANPTPCVDPDPVACAPDSGLAEGVDQDCDGLADNDCDEPYTDDEFIRALRGDDEEIAGDVVQSWIWTGDPLLGIYESARDAIWAVERHYGAKLDWWQEERGCWMAHRPKPANDDCDDVTPCWCGETDPLFDDEGLDATCGGSGTLICHCGGDLCVCHHHGETECPGCEHCAELEGDDGPFEDGDESGPGWCDRCSPDPCTCDDEEIPDA